MSGPVACKYTLLMGVLVLLMSAGHACGAAKAAPTARAKY